MVQPNILFVDDDPGIAIMARTLLDEHGYHAAIAPNGDVALILLKEGVPFELLITDVVLPGTLDGYGLAHQARLIRPRIHVVYSTGFPNVANVRAQGAIFGTVLAKPWSVTDLLVLTNSMIGNQAIATAPCLDGVHAQGPQSLASENDRQQMLADSAQSGLTEHR